MIITSDTVQHELTIPTLNTIGKVGDNEKVVCEAVLYVNSSLTFPHTYTQTQTRYPEQTGTETKTIEEIEYSEGSLQFPPQATLVKEDGVAYYEYPKTEVGTVVEKEIEVPVYDIPAPVQEKVEVTEDKTVSEFAGFSVEFTVEGIENFVPFGELTEEIVLDWIPESVIQPYLAQHEEKLLLEQDKILNPLKYQKDSPVPPWNLPKIENATVLDPSSEG